MKIQNSYYGIVVALILLMSACTDEQIPRFANLTDKESTSRADNVHTGSLVQNADGTWTANKRVALVGPGRIINDLGGGLISVAQFEMQLENLMDLDLTNAAVFGSSLASVEAGMPIVSVKDMYRTYAAGQKAGFIYRNQVVDGNLLKLELLSGGFWLEFYNDGMKVGSAKYEENETTGVLSLGLLTLPSSNDGVMELALVAECDQPFDEVRMGTSGIDISALNTFEICYAFVGENPEIPINKDNFPNVSVDANLMSSEGNVIDADLSNHATYADVLVATPHSITVDAGETIPTGYEVGFYFKEASILDLGLLSGGTSLFTYSEEGVQQDEADGNTTVLSLSLITSEKRKINMITEKDCQQVMLRIYSATISLGGGEVYYAYVREPMQLDPSNYFTVANDKTEQAYYNLMTPQKGSVTYSIVSKPDGANAQIGTTVNTGTYRLVNMNKEGDYVIKAVYSVAMNGDENETTEMTHQFTIKKVSEGTGCNNWITQTNHGATLVDPIEDSSGCLLCLSAGNEGTAKLIDADPTNYMTYTGVLDLAANKPIIAIHTDQITPEEGGYRVGYVMQADNQFLTLDALKFFRVRLYNERVLVNTETEGGVTDDNALVDLNLLNGDAGMIRFSVKTTEPFDQIELWTSGVANLGLVNRIRLYGAFYEAVGNCENVSALTGTCMEIMSPLSHGLDIDYENMKLAEGLVNVGGFYGGLEGLIDNDKDTHAMTNSTVSLLTGSTIALKFNEVPAGQAIGVVFKNTASVLDLSLFQDMTLRLYNGDNLVVDTSNSGLLGLSVISSGGYSTFEVTPDQPVNRMEFEIGGLLSAAENIQLTGIYLRADTDGDGIPDCAEEDGEEDVVNLTYVGHTEHVCENLDGEENRSGKGTVRIDMFGGEVGKTYSLYYYAIEGNEASEERKTLSCVLQEDEEQNRYFALELPIGEYYIGIEDDAVASRAVYNGAHAVVHPLQTIWLGTTNTDWNNWDNWSRGVPWGCTDVIIPATSESKALTEYVNTFGNRYPVLEEADEAVCANIHFEPGAELVNTHYLTYDRAFVDCLLESGKDYLLSAPLKEMATGDWFIGTLKGEMDGKTSVDDLYFTTWTDDNLEVTRFTPIIYQSFWSKAVYGMKATNTTTSILPGTTQWTAPFNAVRQRYETGTGFKLRTASTGNTYVFSMPKYHSIYWYYNADTQSKTGIYEDLAAPVQGDDAIRTGLGGRFAYEGNEGETTWPITIELTNEFVEGSGTSDFLAGNPFMTYVDVAAFLNGNSTISSLKVFQNGSYVTLQLVDGNLKASDNHSYPYLSPMQGFMVTPNASGNTCTISYNENMLGRKETYSSLMSRSGQPNAEDLLLIRAEAAGKETCASVYHRKGNAKDFNTRLLVDSRTPPPVSVYTWHKDEALDFQMTGDRKEIPIGLYLPEAKDVRLSLEAGADWEGWMLVDRHTGKQYDLNSSLKLSLPFMETNTDRFVLQKRNE